MKQTIWSLWNGDILPCERCGENDPEIENLLVLMKRNRDNFNKNATAKQQEIFEKYVDCVDEYTDLITQRAFEEGFSLACKLTVEALSTW